MASIFEANSTLQILESNIYFQQLSSFVGRTYIELFLFTIGLFIYALFVWHFYKKLAKRDLFEIDSEKHNLPGVRWRRLKIAVSRLGYIMKYLIIFPLYISFWFAILSFFLFILAKEVAVNQIILMSIVLISTIRMASYYKEELANDLAKLLPFALLAIILMDPTFFKLEILYNRLQEIPSLAYTILQFLIFTIVFEWILRIGHSLKVRISGNDEDFRRKYSKES